MVAAARKNHQIIAFSLVGAVWLSAGAVGVWIGMDLGRAFFG